MIILCSWLAEVHFDNLQFLEAKIGENFAIYIYIYVNLCYFYKAELYISKSYYLSFLNIPKC